MQSVALLSSRAAIAQRPFVAAQSSSSNSARPQRLVVLAAKPVKAETFRSLTREEIDNKVDELKREMFAMRIKFAKREDYKRSEYYGLKRQVAQLLTVRREQEIALGIDSRASRAAERKRLVESGLGQFAPKQGKNAH